MITGMTIDIRKATIGWWVAGRWCPTDNIRNHELRKRYGPTAPLRVEFALAGCPVDHLTDQQLTEKIRQLSNAFRHASISVKEAERNLAAAGRAARASADFIDAGLPPLPDRLPHPGAER